MNAETDSESKHLEDIERALIRAAQRAEDLARETGTPLVLWEEGRVVSRIPERRDKEHVASAPDGAGLAPKGQR